MAKTSGRKGISKSVVAARTTSVVPDVPPELADAILTGKCALFVGAGLAQGTGYPGWGNLLKGLADRCRALRNIPQAKVDELKALVDRGRDLLMVAQEINDILGDADFKNELVSVFAVDRDPTPTYLQFPEINFSLAVTTNYDTLLENTYSNARKRIQKSYMNNEIADYADALWKGKFFILKAHGDVDHRSTMVITERDYRNLIQASPGYTAVMSSIFTLKTVLFLGASLSDPEIKLLLSYLHGAFHGHGQRHFALISRNEFTDTEVNRWTADYRVRCLTYTPSTNAHPEVEAFVRKLPRAVAPRGRRTP